VVPERLEYLGRFDGFYRMLIEQAKQNIVSEADFYMIIKAKVGAMDRERREEVIIKVELVK